MKVVHEHTQLDFTSYRDEKNIEVHNCNHKTLRENVKKRMKHTAHRKGWKTAEAKTENKVKA